MFKEYTIKKINKKSEKLETYYIPFVKSPAMSELKVTFNLLISSITFTMYSSNLVSLARNFLQRFYIKYFFF